MRRPVQRKGHDTAMFVHAMQVCPLKGEVFAR